MNLVAIVLAAGKAQRFGANKLTALFRGKPLLTHALDAASAAPVSKVILVCAASLDPVASRQTLPNPRKEIQTVTLDSESLSASLKAGVSAASDTDGAFIFLGDMPLVPHDMAAKLVPLLGNNVAALPRYHGKPGHPVLLSRRIFPDIAGLTGDHGAGRLLRQRDDVHWLDTTQSGVLADIDTRDDLTRLMNTDSL